MIYINMVQQGQLAHVDMCQEQEGEITETLVSTLLLTSKVTGATKVLGNT